MLSSILISILSYIVSSNLRSILSRNLLLEIRPLKTVLDRILYVTCSKTFSQTVSMTLFFRARRKITVVRR